MTTFGSAGQVAGDAGRPRLDVALWRTKAGILALAMGAGLVTFLALPEHGPLGLLVGLAGTLLAIIYFVARDRIGTPRDVCIQAAKQATAAARAEPSDQSAAGFLERLRQSLAVAEREAEDAAQAFKTRGFTRIRRAGKTVPENAERADGLSGGNELRHYLRRQLAAPASRSRKTGLQTLQIRRTANRPVFASLDAVLDHILAAGRGTAPRALLVAGAPAMVDATAEAISIARALVVAGYQAVLLDLAHGPHAVAAALRLSRAPGLTCLSAGRARFEDIIRIDAETPLHVIAAGNPRFASSVDANARFNPIFAALTETYDSVVLHADRAALLRHAPLLGVELAAAVAVVPAGMSASADLGDFAALGCQIIACEQGGKVERPRFMGWAAAG